MKSPFPGMDPYIEACGLWEGFHNRLIAKIDETHSLASHHHIEWAGIIMSYLPRYIRNLWLNKLDILPHRDANAIGNCPAWQVLL